MIPKRLTQKNPHFCIFITFFRLLFLRHLSLSLVPGIRTPPKSENVFCSILRRLPRYVVLPCCLAWQKKTWERGREMCFVSLYSNAQYVSVSRAHKIPYLSFSTLLIFLKKKGKIEKNTYFLDFIFYAENQQLGRLSQIISLHNNGITSAAAASM